MHGAKVDAPASAHKINSEKKINQPLLFKEDYGELSDEEKETLTKKMKEKFKREIGSLSKNSKGFDHGR